MHQALQQSILQTLAYFSVASFPLTKEEILRHLWKGPNVSLTELENELQVLVDGGVITEKWSYYFLLGEEKTIEIRRRAVVFNDQKLKKARRACRLIAWVPFLRAVMVCNSVGREVAVKESDIDLFIVADKGRLWVVRSFTNFILRLFGLRTYNHKGRDRICLSFFIITSELDLAPYRAIAEDIHFAYWLHQMVPIFDPENYYAKILAANIWVDNLLPNRKTAVSNFSLRLGILGTITKRFFEIAWKGPYGDLIEKQGKAIQWMKIKPKVKELAGNSDTNVVINDSIVKLHEHDARLNYREAWLKKQNRIYVAAT